MAFDLYRTVTDKVVAHLEEVLAAGETWRKPYIPTPRVQPVNLDGRPYRGMNFLLLALADAPSGCWGTLKRWNAAGARVRKGERSSLIVFWKATDKAEARERAERRGQDPDEAKASLLLRYSTVFSAEQVEGFDLPAWQAKHGRRAARPSGMDGATPAEFDRAFDVFHRFHGAQGIGFENHDGLPCYSPSLDRVRMPPPERFHLPNGYLGIWAHELVHATGHERRLNRNLSTRFGSEAYAMEELVAELGAAMAMAALDVDTEPRRDHACYLASWLRVLKADKKAVLSVASKAQAAVDLILSGEATATTEPIAA